jgi:hypothetical protein
MKSMRGGQLKLLNSYKAHIKAKRPDLMEMWMNDMQPIVAEANTNSERKAGDSTEVQGRMRQRDADANVALHPVFAEFSVRLPTTHLPSEVRQTGAITVRRCVICSW